MSQIRLVPLDRPDVPPHPLSEKLRGQLVYFAAPPGAADAPALRESEYWFRAGETAQILEEGFFHLVSPLDTANMTEVEISEEQEALLEWLQKNDVRHTRVEE